MNKTIRILLVDDHELVRQGLRHMLELEEDMEVVGDCANGEEAFSKMTKLHPDIVLMDAQMLGMNGIEVLQKIEEMGSSPTLIVLTNYSYRQYRARCIYLGADFFFDKSTEFEKIPEVLEELIQNFHS